MTTYSVAVVSSRRYANQPSQRHCIQANKRTHNIGLCSEIKMPYLLPCRVRAIERRTLGMRLLMHAVRSPVECGSKLKAANFFVTIERRTLLELPLQSSWCVSPVMNMQSACASALLNVRTVCVEWWNDSIQNACCITFYTYCLLKVKRQTHDYEDSQQNETYLLLSDAIHACSYSIHNPLFLFYFTWFIDARKRHVSC